jgi:hypothetical protein
LRASQHPCPRRGGCELGWLASVCWHV